MRFISNKSQVLVYDFFVALSIFLVAIMLLLFNWNLSLEEISERKRIEYLSSDLNKIAAIFDKEGFPLYWNSENVKEIGLLNGFEINWTKLISLKDLGYSKVASLLALSSNYYLRLYNSSNKIFEFGKLPSNTSTSFRLDRIGILNKTLVRIEIVVWK